MFWRTRPWKKAQQMLDVSPTELALGLAIMLMFIAALAYDLVS